MSLRVLFFKKCGCGSQLSWQEGKHYINQQRTCQQTFQTKSSCSSHFGFQCQFVYWLYNSVSLYIVYITASEFTVAILQCKFVQCLYYSIRIYSGYITVLVCIVPILHCQFVQWLYHNVCLYSDFVTVSVCTVAYYSVGLYSVYISVCLYSGYITVSVCTVAI